MADKYCDHGAYGAYAAVPTWGSAQDGDGTAKTVGTPSTASVVFTGVPSSGVIAVLGQTITFTRVTSADVCANNLAAAINASTAVATGPASFTTLSQVRNHLYARGPANGAPAGTCQIMTRQASASHAGLICATHTLNNVSSPDTINFEGGTGGCWGFLLNAELVAWPSAIALGAYGVMASVVPFTGALMPGDNVKVRSGKTLTTPTAGSGVSISLGAMGTAEAPVVFDVDDGTEWVGDGPEPVIVVQRTFTSNGYALNLTSAQACFAHIKAKTYASGGKSLRFSVFGSSPSIVGSLLVTFFAPVLVESVEFSAPGGTLETNCRAVLGMGSNSVLPGRNPTYKDVRVVNPGNPNAVISGSTSNYVQRMDLIGVDFVMTAPLIALPNFMETNTFASSSERRYTFESCRFIGFVAGSRFFAAGQGSAGVQSVVIKNTDLGGLELGPGLITSAGAEVSSGNRGVFASTQYGTRDFVMEQTGRLFVEWRASFGRPTLNARLNDNVTPWSIFAVPSVTPGNIGKNNPAVLPRLSKEIPSNADLPEGARTLTLEFLVESTLAAWTKADLSLQVEYMGSDNILRVFSTYDTNAAALETSTVAWSTTSWNGQTWLKRKLTVITPSAVQAGSEVSFYVQLHTAAANETVGVIVDPEITVS